MFTCQWRGRRGGEKGGDKRVAISDGVLSTCPPDTPRGSGFKSHHSTSAVSGVACALVLELSRCYQQASALGTSIRQPRMGLCGELRARAAPKMETIQKHIKISIHHKQSDSSRRLVRIQCWGHNDSTQRRKLSCILTVSPRDVWLCQGKRRIHGVSILGMRWVCGASIHPAAVSAPSVPT